MKLFFDQNLSFKLCQSLTDIFPGSTQARLVDMSEADDISIWRYAKENGMVLVSQDADFAELAAIYGSPPKVIWLRMGNQPTAIIAAALRTHRQTLLDFFEDASVACLELY